MAKLMGGSAPAPQAERATIIEKQVGGNVPFPNSFVDALQSQMVSGSGDMDNALNELYNYINKNYPLDDVEKILCAKSKDKIMGNLRNLCGMEVMMYFKQEFVILMNMFKQEGFKYENAKNLLKDFTDQTSDLV